jgi:hypothetical protein
MTERDGAAIAAATRRILDEFWARHGVSPDEVKAKREAYRKQVADTDAQFGAATATSEPATPSWRSYRINPDAPTLGEMFAPSLPDDPERSTHVDEMLALAFAATEDEHARLVDLFFRTTKEHWSEIVPRVMAREVTAEQYAALTTRHRLFRVALIAGRLMSREARDEHLSDEDYEKVDAELLRIDQQQRRCDQNLQRHQRLGDPAAALADAEAAMAALGMSAGDLKAWHSMSGTASSYETYVLDLSVAHAVLHTAVVCFQENVRQMEKLVPDRRSRACRACPRKLRESRNNLLRGLEQAEAQLSDLEESFTRHPWPHPFAVAWHREAPNIVRLRLRWRRAKANWHRALVMDLRASQTLRPRRVLTGSGTARYRFRGRRGAGRPGHGRSSRATRAGPGDGSGSDEPPGPRSRRRLPDVDTRRSSP